MVTFAVMLKSAVKSGKVEIETKIASVLVGWCP